VTLRRPLAIISMFGLVGTLVLPPEHVHVTESEEHGHSEFIHRHFEGHHPGEVGGPAHARAEIDHQDEDAALWIDAPFVVATTAALPSVERVVLQELPELQPRPLPRWTLEFDHISVHDPPWVSPIGLRAPPTSVV
jgi:hypothetical protein